ncbi:elongator complex protein 2 [Primulina eburnea]|uniref:elongator complex protein 2 n=1 Tax=Primulina eburnea TaxID=1245227 RepID=UPI003C6C017D
MASDGDSRQVGVRKLFIGAGCNRIVNNVSWGACDLVSFGAQNSVAIFCPKSAQILATLPGHTAFVNCTHWLPSNKFSFKAKHLERHYLLSGDVDGVIILWELSLVDKKWRNVFHVPEAHKNGVTCFSAIMVSHSDALFASTSSDGTVKVWEVIFPSSSAGDCRLSCLDSITFGQKPMVALSLMEFPGNSHYLALAMGGLDNKIHIYSGERTGKFIHSCELKGHTDWIRSLDFSLPLYASGETSSLLLASSSQDKGIRIWKMALRDSLGNKKISSLASYIKGPIFSAGSSSYQISLESLLIGHEDWVYSVEWQPPQSSSVDGVECYQPLSILSASMDKTMMVWQPEKTTCIWMNVVTVGELSHSALGFYGGHWSPTGDSILANGYGGSFHLWKNIGTSFDDWKPQKVPSGHFSAVSDLSWARGGEYLLSVSHDQTTRIFSPWCKESSLEDRETWHEIGRPQVHGHDINCVTLIRGKGNHRFVSGADEKVSRVFEAPLSFLKTLNHSSPQQSSFNEDVPVNMQILGANMSALGLSQKPIYVQASPDSTERNRTEDIDTLETIPEAVPMELTEPPIEEQLAWHTLWPESHKLYGHGNELFSLCCDHEGKLVASSCKAQSASAADIWLWQVGSWKSVGRLHSHSLTVTQLEFSHDDNFLLAVSRDRHFSVFSIKHTGVNEIRHQLIVNQEAHKRIIWACSWNPYCHEFATGSRDKTVKIWQVEEESSVKLLTTLPMFKSSVTALSWLGVDRQRNHSLLAVGMENGLIELWSYSNTRIENASIEVPNVAVFVRFDPYICHVSAVRRLRWKMGEKTGDPRSSQLASCGDDHSVRIFQIDVVQS